MDQAFFTPKKKHLKQIAVAFQDVYDGKIKKLAISLPPRAGKSYITSLFCAWLLGKRPEGSIMRNSYASDLAEKFSYDIREIIQKPRYLEAFPSIELKKDKRALQDWAITKSRDSAYFCAGVGGPITGKGCTLMAILDDPIKNIEEAMSETILTNIWNWYTSTHLSRLESGCPEIHIATRWSKKDPIGRLTNSESESYSDDWHVISVPALIDGESFCNEIHTTEEYISIKKVTDDFIWEAEFMQNPIEEKGLLYPNFELKKFNMDEIKTKTPDGIIGFTDTADKGNDFLCSVIGKKFGEDTYITDVVFTQDGVEITEPLVADMIINTKADIMRIESNNGGSSFARNVRNILRDKKCYCSVISETTTTNKETRILMNSGYIKEFFYFRNDYKPGSDYDKFMRQITSYVKLGKNKHDDAPDAVTGLAEYAKTFKSKRNQSEQKPHYNFPSEKPKPSLLDGLEVTESFFRGGWDSWN